MIRIFLAVLKRDLLLEASYKLSTALKMLGGLSTLFMWYFLTKAVGETRFAENQGGYFAYTLVGLAIFQMLQVALMGYSRRIREEQVTGTLEAVLAYPDRSAGMLAAWIGRDALLRVATLAIVLGLGAWLGVQFRLSWLSALVILLLAFLAFSAVGILVGCAVVLYKRAAGITGFLVSASVLLGGTFFPLDVLPTWLQLPARWLPLTVGTEAARGALLRGQSLGDLGPSVVYLAVMAVVLLPLAMMLFRWSVWRARKQGSLGHF